MTEFSSLYIISEGDDGPIKIGVSRNPRTRLTDLQIANPRQLTIFVTYTFVEEIAYECEVRLHEELAERRVRGEWFNIRPSFILEYMPDFFKSLGFDGLYTELR